MKSENKDLNGYDGDIGEVDLFGLNEFGEPEGMNPTWGAVIGAGLGTGTAIAVRALATPGGSFDYHKWAEGIGFLVGGATSGVMIAFPGTRAAGWSGLAASFLACGLRQIEVLFQTTEQVTGIGAPVIERLDGFGITVPEYVPQMYGVAGAQVSNGRPPVDLMGGAGALPHSSAQAVEVMGAPLSGLGAHFGATLFGGQ